MFESFRADHGRAMMSGPGEEVSHGRDAVAIRVRARKGRRSVPAWQVPVRMVRQALGQGGLAGLCRFLPSGLSDGTGAWRSRQGLLLLLLNAHGGSRRGETENRLLNNVTDWGIERMVRLPWTGRAPLFGLIIRHFLGFTDLGAHHIAMPPKVSRVGMLIIDMNV
jgi:hypothetical protein